MTPKQIADYLIRNRQKTRTRRGKPCPICQHTDWCLAMEDGSAALCRRTDGIGSVRQYGEYGYLYVLQTGIEYPPVRKRPERSDAELHARWQPRAKQWQDQGRSEIGLLAEILGVSIAALRELGTGWDGKAWTTPERNASGLIVGVSRRFEDGAKRCAIGSRRGLTYSDTWLEKDGPVLIVEGASDTAAGITLGFATIGRPSNRGGFTMLRRLLRRTKRKIIVFGERDRKENGQWPGMEGSRVIAAKLSKALGRSVVSRLLPDGAKDLRAWLNERGVDVEDNGRCRVLGQELARQL